MPRLVNLQNLENINLREYFVNVEWSSYKNCWTYNIADTYPHVSYAHMQTINETDNKFFIDLRRFVERTAGGDVMYSYRTMDYSYCWNKDTASSWDHKWDRITHGYWAFNFEYSEDLVMWQLMKPALMTDIISKYRPDKDWHTADNTRNW